MSELDVLFAGKHDNCRPWLIGKIPRHFKRLSIGGLQIAAEDDWDDTESDRVKQTKKEAIRLAKLGASKVAAAFGDKLFFCQSLIAGAIFSDEFDEIIVVTPSQYGKAIDDDEPVLTRSGWKRHGDLVVGDEVISQDGKFVKVLYVHPKCEMDRVIVLETGEQVVCHHNHEWIVNDRNSKKKNVPVSTADIENSIATTKAPRYTMPVRKAIVGEHKNLAVPPYVMGVWLGDGYTTKGQICSCKKDIAVLDKCREYYPNGNEWVHKDTGVITRSMVGLANDLTTYNMCFQRKDTPEKHIPQEYLTASVEQRLELLAGLIDTDGYTYFDKRWGGKSRMYFTTAGEKLKDTFEELIATFGWKTSTVKIEPKVSSSGIHGKKPYWVIGFNPTMDVPCVLERKRPNGFSKQKGTGIVEIRKCSGRQGNCITVEGGTYRVGKKLIPTHNSWLLGRVSLDEAYEGHKQYLAGAAANVTSIIMGHVIQATQNAAPEIRNGLLNKKNELERLATSVSKQRLAFSSGGFIESITLGDTYNDNLAANKAVGRAGDFYIDEAALVSDNALSEMGRREFAKIDGTKYKQIMISNPHRPGTFYDKLTQENVPDRTFILWIDALTATEEERFSQDLVFESDFAKHKSTMRRYLLCVLDTEGGGMFSKPKIVKGELEGDYVQRFFGVDAAYKGQDSLDVAVTAVGNGKIRIEKVFKVNKPKGKDWLDGKTSRDIINKIARMALAANASMICVDQGYGVWLIEGLANKWLNVRAVNFAEAPTRERVKAKHYAAVEAANKRAEMHLDFQDLIESGVLEITEEAYKSIEDTLPYVQAERKTNGKIQICPKDEIKAIIGHSPDAFDSVLLSIHAAIRFLGDTAYAIP